MFVQPEAVTAVHEVISAEQRAEPSLIPWVLDLSGFHHIPQLPGGEVRVLPLAVLTALTTALTTTALTTTGLYGLRRRDLPA